MLLIIVSYFLNIVVPLVVSNKFLGVICTHCELLITLLKRFREHFSRIIAGFDVNPMSTL